MFECDGIERAKSIELHTHKKYDEAMVAHQLSIESAAIKAGSEYNMACIYSIQIKKDKAFADVNAAVAAGFNDINQLKTDSEFDNTRGDERIQKLIFVK